MEQENTKQGVISFLKTLPDDVTLEDIMYHLYVKRKILQGIKDIEEGRVVSHEEAKEIMRKWQK
ncbi:MAG: hypothetical protein ACFFCS_07860 [Candidatus Hodarchaeota archaeon]